MLYLSNLIYGCEIVTLILELGKRINATEIWIPRRILKTSWTEHIIDKFVLRQANYSRQLLKTIRKRQLTVLDHVMRREGL